MEVSLVLMKEVLDRGKYFFDVLQGELIFVDEPHNLQNARLEDLLIRSFE